LESGVFVAQKVNGRLKDDAKSAIGSMTV
jgi:hypothetical protein